MGSIKHIGIRYHFVLDAVEDQVIPVKYTLSTDNKVDRLTKPSVTSPYKFLRPAIGCLPQVQHFNYWAGVLRDRFGRLCIGIPYYYRGVRYEVV